MVESHEPWRCRECDTVNAWLAESCRGCSRSREEVELSFSLPPLDPRSAPDEESAVGGEGEAPVDDEPPRPEATSLPGVAGRAPVVTFGLRWLAGGAAILIVLLAVGEHLVERLIVSDPTLAPLVIEIMKPRELPSHSEREALKAKGEQLVQLMLDRDGIVAATVVLLLLPPLLAGFVVGFFSRSIRGGALAVGVGAVAVFAIAQVPPAVFLMLVTGLAALGLLGAFAGERLARKRQA